MQDHTQAPNPGAGRPSGRPAPSGTPLDDLADDPTSSAYLKITTLGPTTVEAHGTVPLICVTGILGAVVIAYIAAADAPADDLIWFLGLAVIDLLLTGLVILRLTRIRHTPHDERPPRSTGPGGPR